MMLAQALATPIASTQYERLNAAATRAFELAPQSALHAAP